MFKSISAHKPVLVQEVLESLALKPHGLYLDVTFGSGGHTRAILEKEPTAKVIAMDWDATALDTFGPAFIEEFGDRISFIWGNFATLYKLVKKHDLENIDGVLADFGTSQIQISKTPGISFWGDSPLDMRLSPAHSAVTAADILNKASEKKLAEIFFQLGQEPKGKQIARAIVQARSGLKISTSAQLVKIIESVIRSKSKRGLHPATKIFQALRIYINHELDNIKAFLPAAVDVLAPEGRLVCISFHSLEDRLVKQFFKEQEQKRIIKVITPKALTASPVELEENPSSRSAKLRVSEKTEV